MDPQSTSAAVRGAPPVFDPVRLDGRWVRLEPLRWEDLPGLCSSGQDESLWTWFPQDHRGPEGMHRFVATALAEQEAGRALAFTCRDARNGAIIGSTRFAALAPEHRRTEIGWTWYAPASQRTPVNTETKFLLLRHAFETLGLIRVEFKTDALNLRSRAALQRIGAIEEGVFRKHLITWSGRIRDSVYFSITDGDWPTVKQRLEQQLARPFTSAA